MATRSNIGVEIDGKLKYIYCHWGGYLDGVGKQLLLYFNTQQLAVKLVEGGDISSISAGRPEYYAQRSRWDSRSDDEPWADVQPQVADIGYDFLNNSYAYLFRDGQWFYKTYSTRRDDWLPLVDWECYE